MAIFLFPVLTLLDDKVTVEELLMRRLGENGEMLREKQWDDRIPLNTKSEFVHNKKKMPRLAGHFHGGWESEPGQNLCAQRIPKERGRMMFSP